MKFLLAVVIILFSQSEPSLAQLSVPPLNSRVNDTVGLLSASERRGIEERLAQLERAKGAQVAVLIVNSTAPESIEQFGIRVADSWKLGRRGIADGAILIVALQDRTLRIEVGRGLEGALTDAVSRRIMEEQISPHVKSGLLALGIEAGVEAICSVIEGEGLPTPIQNSNSFESSPVNGLIPILFLVFFAVTRTFAQIFGRLLGGMILAAIVAFVGSLFLSISIGIILGLAAFVLVLFGGVAIPTGHQRYGGGGSYAGRFGGGGGFRGGGGGFAGGGASGRW